MQGKKRTSAPRLLIISALLLAVSFLFYPTLIVVIKNDSSGSILFSSRERAGYEFATLIKHSVQRTPVYEYYRVEKDGTLLVTATMLQDLGWGMPSTSTGPVKFKNNFMIMDSINRPLQKLPFRISYITNPQLVMEGRNIELNAFVEDGDLIEISVIKQPWIISRIRGDINVFQEKS